MNKPNKMSGTRRANPTGKSTITKTTANMPNNILNKPMLIPTNNFKNNMITNNVINNPIILSPFLLILIL